MTFKFAISLLFVVIIENSVSQPTTEEVIEDAFNFAFNYNNDLKVDVRIKSLCKSDFLDFVGEEDSLQYINNYWTDNLVSPEAQDQICLKDFSDLVSWICVKQNIDITEFLKKRIAEVELITRTFNILQGHYEHQTIKTNMSIRLSEFLDFVGKADNIQNVNIYWAESSVPPNAQVYITFKKFKDLVYWICTKNNYDVKDFLEKKFAVAKAIDRSFDYCVSYYEHYCAINESRHSQYDYNERHGPNYYICESDVLDFVGEDKRNMCLQCVNDYWAENPASSEKRDKIYFKEFKDIMYLIYSKQPFDLKDFLAKRIAVAEGIRQGFYYAINYEYFNPNRPIVFLPDFLKLVGKDNNDYLGAATSVLPKGEDKLYMKDFKNILYLVFANQETVVGEFLKKRMTVATIFQEVFDFAHDGFYLGEKDNLRLSQFVDFVGRVNNLHYVNLYWAENMESLKEQDNINFERFTDIINWICSRRNIDILDFLKNRKAAAEVIREAYNFVLHHYGIVKGEGFGQSEFLDFVGKDANLQHVNEYWSWKSLLQKHQDKMSLKHFMELVYWICSKQGYVPEEFLNERIEIISSKS